LSFPVSGSTDPYGFAKAVILLVITVFVHIIPTVVNVA
jgi:hypothetical protein